jgi:hypothetical protein
MASLLSLDGWQHPRPSLFVAGVSSFGKRAMPQPGFVLHHFLLELLFLPIPLAGIGMRTIMEGHS